jgi:hypothetical protein
VTRWVIGLWVACAIMIAIGLVVPAWFDKAGDFALYTITPWVVICGFSILRAMRRHRRLSRLGWPFGFWEVLFRLSTLRESALELLPSREECAMLPIYSENRSPYDNLVACVEFVRAQRRQRAVLAPIEAILRERETWEEGEEESHAESAADAEEILRRREVASESSGNRKLTDSSSSAE